MKFLFWNLNRRDIPGLVRAVTLEHNIDVLILAECVIPDSVILFRLNTGEPDYQYARGNCARVMIFVRFDRHRVSLLYESHRTSIRRLTLPAGDPLILAATHLPSKLNMGEESQVYECVHLARVIDELERKEGHQRTLLIGDLNMNPFEHGLVAARGGLNAVMDRAVAARSTRTLQTEKYKYFYNPMWNYLGDHRAPAGSFFFESSEAVCYFWNLFDQVLLRPALLPHFAPENLRILTQVGDRNLLNPAGRPCRDTASDHLPILLQLDL
ncbi:MAG: endonuclease/exonuclease/phosphatase family protein [Candidatus Korobacteraceae bacterium]